jgi:hypothetical protein
VPLNFHEDLKRAESIRGSSDRTFGLVIGLAFAVFGFSPLRHGGHIRVPLLALSGAFLAVALVRPSLLHEVNRAWTKLGLLLSKIVNPVVMTVLFFLVFAPVGILLRMLGKDPLRLKLDRQLTTYWIVRHSPDPQQESMARQF